MIYDVAIIGGGPAGMMAAGQAGALGARVVLLEKNNKPGIKLLITGKERCNITNNTEDIRRMIEAYGQNGKFLFSALHNFGVNDVINFFEEQGVKTKTERGDRVFPLSDKSQDVLDALLGYLKKNQVVIKNNSTVKSIASKNSKIEKINLFNGQSIVAKNYIIATGGKSYPATGSTGDGYTWLESLGHKIIKPRPVLTPIICKENFLTELEGLSLKNVAISLFENDMKIASEFGEAIFTGQGMSGPIILNLSKHIIEGENRKYQLVIDFKPALDNDVLDKRIVRDFQDNSNKQFKNNLSLLLPNKIIPVFLKLSKIDASKQVNLITKDERRVLLGLLKDFRVTVSGLHGFDKAIVTAGGVDLREVDPKTMKSKLIENLYMAGEVLDLDGPTGGYNLQVCWSTGFTAGQYAAT